MARCAFSGSRRSWRHIGSPQRQLWATGCGAFKPAHAGDLNANVMSPAFAGFPSFPCKPTACAVGYRYVAGYAG
jgi:hypothetical protein